MNTIEELEKYAEEHFVPIARRGTVDFLKSLIKLNNYTSVLEIGAAIGYTSIQLAMMDNVHVTTYEYWPPRIEVCKQNIIDFNLEDKITFYDRDCFEKPIEEMYDLIFIDGAKAKTISFFEFLKNNITDKGTIVIDNIDLNVINQIVSKSKKARYQRIVEKTKNYFSNIHDYNVKYMDIGDGIYVITKI